jgi:hypothetical protein
MSEARIFGPTRGAGVQVNERVGQETIEQGRLGSTVLIGPFERGLEDDITILPSGRAFDRKMGGLLDPGEFDVMTFGSVWTPLMAQHFWKKSRGAGTLICLRVAPKTNTVARDDRPDKSKILVWNRESSPVLIGQITAHNGGSWAGKRKVYQSKISGVPGTDFPASNQIQLSGLAAKTLKYDEFRNGQVVLEGLPGNSYKIVKNNPTGLITLESDQDVRAAWASAAGETYGSASSSAQTFNLGTVTAPWTIAVTTETGGPDTATILAASASLGNDGAPAFNARAEWIDFNVNGVVYRVTFAGTEAAIDDYLDAIEASIPGIDARAVGLNIQLFTDRKGTSASVTISAAQSNNMIIDVFSTATPTAVAGTGDVANHFEATAAEIAADLSTAVAAGTSAAVVVASGGIITVTTSVGGSTGSVTMSGSLRALLGFPSAAQLGDDASLNVTLVRDNVNYRSKTKAVDIEYRDGGLRPDTEFGMIVRINGTKVLSYENLSMETGKSNYWADTINKDPNNDVITVSDTFSGDRLQATARPANHYGESTALTATRLTIADPTYSGLTVGVGAWVPSLAWNSWGTYAKPQRLRVQMTGAAAFTVTTDQGNISWIGTLGVAVDMGDYAGNMTVTTASGVVTVGDYFFVYLKPLEIDELIGGRVYPNVEDVSQRNQNFEIIDNGIDWVDISALSDLTDSGANVAGKEYRIQYRAQMEQGYDGYLAGMSSSDYESLLDPSTTPMAKLRGRGYGLVKMAVPGVAYLSQALALQQKIKTLAARFNWMAKIEMPWQFHDWDVYYEQDLVDWITNTFVRGDDADYASIHFPSFGYIRDPFAESESEARTVLVPMLGYILGNEAYVAKSYKGYHKVPAGTSVTIPEVVELPAIGRPESPKPLDEEVLNPSGINILKWKQGGSYVIQWGARTLSQNPAFKFYQKRTMLSQYENDLLEGFDFTIFDINDPISDADVVAVLHDYFLPEYNKRALRGTSFVGGQDPAAIFKMDAENNTDATRAAGDQIVEISLRLADTIERLRIFVGPMGLVEGTV